MKYYKLILSLAAGFTVFGCVKNKLDQPALGLDESKLANRKGVEGLLIGAYSLLDGIGTSASGWGSAASNWIYGSVCGSEAYTGSRNTDQPDIRSIESFTHNALNYYFITKWITVYSGIQRANDVLRIMKKAKDISAEDQKRISAEARFLRGHYHFEAIKMWNKVPYVDETITYSAGNYYLPNDVLIWPAIENDFKFAMENLPLQMTFLGIGRANKYAAEAFLAKAYLFQGKFTQAKPLLDDLIQNGITSGGNKYALVNYADNFNLAFKNFPEAVFSVQMSVNDNSGGNNGNLGDILNYPFSDQAPGQCCGFFQPTQYLVNHFKTDSITGLPDLDGFNASDVLSDQGLKSTDPFTPYSGTLDPRLDWTVGRRGIPYLDWGYHPGYDWIRDQNYSGPYSPLKNVFRKDQLSHYSDASFWTTGSSANNVNLIRFADVLLWAAEVEVETGSLEKARDYVNTIRARVADPSGWVKKQNGTAAANYKIGLYPGPWGDQAFARKAVRYERQLELAMEGHRFFDLVRWGIADKEINTYLQKEKRIRSYLVNAKFIKGKNEYFPIPQSEIDNSAGADKVPKLKQNPGY